MQHCQLHCFWLVKLKLVQRAEGFAREGFITLVEIAFTEPYWVSEKLASSLILFLDAHFQLVQYYFAVSAMSFMVDAIWLQLVQYGYFY